MTLSHDYYSVNDIAVVTCTPNWTPSKRERLWTEPVLMLHYGLKIIFATCTGQLHSNVTLAYTERTIRHSSVREATTPIQLNLV